MVKTKTPTKAPKAATVRKTVTAEVETKKAPAKASKALFAVFTTGGKQYRVAPGDSLKIEKLQGEHKEGDKLVFDKVLIMDDGKSWADVGTPFIKGAEVKATLKKISRYKTVDVIKYKQKSRYFKKYGHRQPYFEVKIDSIS